jgi:tRNA(adenine34) deaminase
MILMKDGMITSPFGVEQDYEYMGIALTHARTAASMNEVPVGAVVVDNMGRLLAHAYNQVELQHTQVAHAEMLALRSAAVVCRDWRLKGCWLYVTLEPCFMCMGLIYLSRLTGVVYGAPSPLYGAQLDSSRMVSVYKIDSVRIIAGVRADEATCILKQFFKQKRNNNDTC